MTQLATVIVHYGPAEATVAVAKTALTYSASVVVVANDRSRRPPTLDPRVKWMLPERNLGFGDAFTWGAVHGKSELLLVLNNDVIVGSDTVKACVAAFTDPAVGVVGPRLTYADGSLQSGAGALSRFLCQPSARAEPGPSGSDCAWVTGAVMFVRRKTLEQVGMDGSYFLGHEDADFCVRALEERWRVRCEGSAPAVHFGSQVISGPRWSYYATRNRVWFVRARFGRTRGMLTWLSMASRVPRVLLADTVKRRDLTSTRLMLLGLRHAVRPKPSMAAGPWQDEPVPASVMRW